MSIHKKRRKRANLVVLVEDMVNFVGGQVFAHGDEHFPERRDRHPLVLAWLHKLAPKVLDNRREAALFNF